MLSGALACVVGARPNFVKLAPVLAGLERELPGVRPIVVHTGQHYDEAMSARFFDQLGLPAPDVHLEVGSGSHGRQTGRVLERYEDWLLGRDPRPLATLVVGDVNSTVACALASVKLGVPVIHVEAGLRSFDRSMPEEINRVLTDAISDLLLVSEPSGVENLRREGRPEDAILLVGNVMIDALETHLPRARALAQHEALGFEPGGYALWTVHRPANVDDPERLEALIEVMAAAARRLPAVLPVHPRTRQRLEDADLWRRLASVEGIVLTPPLGYLEFLSLQASAALIATDSGGIQEEATVLGVPCLTLRTNTERPITVDVGTNTLVGDDHELLLALIDDVLAGRYKRGARPPLWDGRAGSRVVQAIEAFLRRDRSPPAD